METHENISNTLTVDIKSDEKETLEKKIQKDDIFRESEYNHLFGKNGYLYDIYKCKYHCVEEFISELFWGVFVSLDNFKNNKKKEKKKNLKLFIQLINFLLCYFLQHPD